MARHLPSILAAWARDQHYNWFEAAAFFGVSKSTWYNWLTGRSVPVHRDAQRIAAALGRPELYRLIAEDRDAHRREMRGLSALSPMPTPRTLVIDRTAR